MGSQWKSLTSMCPLGILRVVTKPKLSKASLKAQAEELERLRGDRTQAEWREILGGVPERTYIRYENGQRPAPPSLMKLARLTGRKRGA